MRIMMGLPLAAITLLSAAPAFARDDRPVACIFTKTMMVKRPDMVALVRSNFAPTDKGGKLAMSVVGESVNACRVKYGWSDKKQLAALNFLRAHVLREDAVYRGTKFGLTDEMLDGLVGSLDAGTKAAFLGGQPTAAMTSTVFAYLNTAGLKSDSLSAEDSSTLNSVISDGIAGTLVQQQAEAAYAA